MDLSPLEKKLTELKSLHERGLIDAEDYKEEKRKALQGLGENSREHAAPPLHKIKPAAPNDAAPPSEAPNGGSLESEDKYDIVVKEQCGDETTLRVKGTTPLRKIVDALCKKKNVEQGHFLAKHHLLFDGTRFGTSSLEMTVLEILKREDWNAAEDGRVVSWDLRVEQHGGASESVAW
eukprot:CAMPEP_0172625322 /NCGR_PEP_ID=MMETSP1068-20121228/143076_1 /TAXON_ID=35684 /ORGANISM="Pseudopedinella elastica, Strain CCMP716" /LENGTH=177 /DNA_ID=CAMNT_0013434579 /DNA_START=75 /DNA_END=605 /DNA_ORIENTATION=+